MTLEETSFLLLSIEALYPNCTFKDATVTSRIWSSMLFDQKAEHIMNALAVYARTDSSGFAPSVGKLISLAEEQANPQLTAEEAVGLVRKAVQNGFYHSTEEFGKLPPTVQKAVVSPQNLRAWAAMDMNEFEAVVLSHLRKAYMVEAKRETEKKTLMTAGQLLTENRKYLLG